MPRLPLECYVITKNEQNVHNEVNMSFCVSVSMFVPVLKAQGEHSFVSHRGGEDHHATRDARQGQHLCSKGRNCSILLPHVHHRIGY